MFFYDIMYLYRAYEKYVEDENERNAEDQARYQEQYESQMPNPADYKMPDVNSITRGITSSIPKFNMPKI